MRMDVFRRHGGYQPPGRDSGEAEDTGTGRRRRPRWRDAKGRIYEWDKRHGRVEVYDKTGKRHLGEFDPMNGKRLAPADPRRRVEP